MTLIDLTDAHGAPDAVIYGSIEELRAAVGMELGPTHWLEIDQARVDGFADDTLDHQWIHVDVSRAASGPFGTTVAHGFLTLSLLPYLMNQMRRMDRLRMGVNYGLDRVRFPSPVRVGSRVRARMTLIDLVELSSSAVQVTNRVVLEVEGSDKPGCVAELVARYYFEERSD